MEFLAVKNWDIYQPKNKKSYPWIRDYKDKDFDRDVSRLTVFQRGILDMCCRLRGRLAKNLSNDPQWIVGAVSILPQERRNAISAIGQLVAKGFLIPTNQEDSFVPLEGKKEKRVRVEKKKDKPSAAPSACRPDVSKSVAQNRHPRIKDMIFAAYKEHNSVEPPWDGGEGKQLDALLRATPGWHDGQIAQCLANMYASGGFAKGTRPREFLPRLPKYLHGSLNEFNRENGNGKRREQSANQTIAAVTAGVDKFLRRKAAVGAQDVSGTTATIPGDPGGIHK